jgi:heat shock protein HslJ
MARALKPGAAAIGLLLGAGWGSGCQTPGATSATAPVISAGAPAAAVPLGGTTWLVQEIEGRRTSDATAPTVTFEGVERVAGSTGCNRYSGPLEVSGSALRVGDTAMTRMACPPAVMAQEERFVAALAAVRGQRADGVALLLVDERGRTLLRLVPR